MQTKKADVFLDIIKSGKTEFLNNGFNGTSMRSLAKSSGISLSNIYNYFKNKDDIYLEILSPVVTGLKKFQDSHNLEVNLTLDVFVNKKHMESHAVELSEFIFSYRDELKLLFFNSTGSSLENFKEEYIQNHSKIGLEYLNLMCAKFPKMNFNVSEFFIHTASSWWYTNLSEMIMHDLNRDELKIFLNDYIKFSTAGWKSIMLV